MKIAIVGAGAMGSAIGGFFSLGGAEVWLVGHSSAHLDKVRADGLRMEINGESVYTPMHTCIQAKDIRETMDLVMISTKGKDVETAIREALCLFDDHTVYTGIQNGLGSSDILLHYVDPLRVCVSIIQLGASIPASGTVRVLQRKGAMLSIGPVAQEEPTEEMSAFAAILSQGGLDAYVMSKSEIQKKIWYKLTANCTSGACCAITRLTLGALTNCTEGAALKRALLEEILAVAEAEGVTGLRERVTATQYWPEDNPMYHHIPSMAQDVCAHKKTEIDFLNGAVVKLGEKHGIPTPCNRVIVNLIHIMESHYDLMF